MRFRILTVLTLGALSSCLLAGCGASTSTASTSSSPDLSPPPAANAWPLTRLIFEDHSTQRLRWLDVLIDQEGRISGGAVTDVPGFKSLDAERQKLVQMREVEGTIVVGVRDAVSYTHLTLPTICSV